MTMNFSKARSSAEWTVLAGSPLAGARPTVCVRSHARVEGRREELQQWFAYRDGLVGAGLCRVTVSCGWACLS